MVRKLSNNICSVAKITVGKSYILAVSGDVGREGRREGKREGGREERREGGKTTVVGYHSPGVQLLSKRHNKRGKKNI